MKWNKTKRYHRSSELLNGRITVTGYFDIFTMTPIEREMLQKIGDALTILDQEDDKRAKTGSHPDMDEEKRP